VAVTLGFGKLLTDPMQRPAEETRRFRTLTVFRIVRLLAIELVAIAADGNEEYFH